MNKIILLSLLVCACQVGCIAQNKKKDYKLLQPDSVVQKLYGDSINRVLFNPKKVRCYLLEGFKNDPKNVVNSDQKTIADYPVSSTVGNIDISFCSVIQALMMSQVNYDFGDFEYKAKFMPYVCYEVLNGKERVNILFAFNKKSWAVEYNGKLIETKYNCEALLVEYFSRLLPEDKYINALKKNINENK